MPRKRKIFDYKRDRPWVENLYIVTQLGLTMAGCIAFCFFVGLYLDRWLGTKGVFITIFIILGVIGGANVVYRQILEIIEQKEDDKTNPENGRGLDKPKKDIVPQQLQWQFSQDFFLSWLVKSLLAKA